MAGETTDLIKRDRGRVLFLFQDQVEMGTVLFLPADMSLVPSVEHSTDGCVPRVTSHPNPAVVGLASQVFPVKIEIFSLASFVGVLVDGIFIVSDVFTRDSAGKSPAIR
jgi:hypothetical protein